MELTLDKTRKGYPALWERGGGWSNTGDAVIIANADGSPKEPIYIRRRGQLACENHALFIVNVNDIIIMTDHHRLDYKTHVYRVESIDAEYKADCLLLNSYIDGEWEWDWEMGHPLFTVNESLQILEAVKAAENKARTYHCRNPFYFAAPAEEVQS
jgi:hypothetical protein